MLRRGGTLDRLLSPRARCSGWRSRAGCSTGSPPRTAPSTALLAPGGAVDRLTSPGGTLERLLEEGGPVDRLIAGDGVVERLLAPAVPWTG